MDTCELESLLRRTRVLKDEAMALKAMPSAPTAPVIVRRAGVQDAIVIVVNFKYLMYYYAMCLAAGIALSSIDFSPVFGAGRSAVADIARAAVRRLVSWLL